MESVKVRIEEDADVGFKFAVVALALLKKAALYINTKKSLWLMDYERALGVIDDYAERCRSAMIGKTDYIIIYPVESAVKVGGQNLIMGECLIMKSENGIQYRMKG